MVTVLSVSGLLQRLFFEHFSSTSFVLLDASRVVAFLVGFRSQSKRHVAYIHFVGVDPHYRGRGLGRSMYLKFFDVVQALGCMQVQSITSPSNKASIQFHLAMGFEVVKGDGVVDAVSVHKDYAGVGQHRVVFSKSLV